jgi:hypothetical protein
MHTIYRITTATPQFDGQMPDTDIMGRPYYRTETKDRAEAMARYKASQGRADVWSWQEGRDGVVLDGTGQVEVWR